MVFSLAYCSPKPSYPASPLLPHQFLISNGFLFECGLGVVDSPSQETLSVSIKVFFLDLDVSWLRVGCGVGFSRLFMLHSEEFQWVEAKFLRERWHWMGTLVRPCAWIGHWKKLYHPLFRFILVYDPLSFMDSLYYRFFTIVSEVEILEWSIAYGRIWVSDFTSLWYKFTLDKAFHSPKLSAQILLSYLHGSKWNFGMHPNGFVGYLVLCFIEMVYMLARMLVWLLLWVFVWKIKVGLWESGDHDGEGIKALTVGYYPPTFSFTHEQSGSSWSDMLFRSLKGHPSFYAYPRFIGISYGSSASNLKLDFIFEYQSSKLTVRVVEDFYFPEMFFALKEKWRDFLPDFFTMSLLTLFMYYAFGIGDIFKLRGLEACGPVGINEVSLHSREGPCR
ncbi:hypothetical protein V6N11_038808 [Hibiscus sabdariffa]|uniref:Uncharacterized protein n=1 Tax=Hibiscus sabdariffa TaxID=183260 RepID=A0ABR2SLP2_9ROSI